MAPITYVEGTECNSVEINPDEVMIFGNGMLRMQGYLMNAEYDWDDPRLTAISTAEINFNRRRSLWRVRKDKRVYFGNWPVNAFRGGNDPRIPLLIWFQGDPE